nr:MAG TPA: hypothetical protein [Caudoviricetes sp.]
MLYLIVYLFDFYGSFINTLLGLLITSTGCGVIAALFALFNFDNKDYEGKESYWLNLKNAYYSAIKMLKILGKTSLILGSLILLLPSKQGLAMLGGVYVGSQVYESIDKSAITQKAIKVLNQELDGYLDSMLKEKETKK